MEEVDVFSVDRCQDQRTDTVCLATRLCIRMLHLSWTRLTRHGALGSEVGPCCARGIIAFK